MFRKLVSSILIVSLTVLLGTTSTFAGKSQPPANQAPVVTAFDVDPEAVSPVPVRIFIATDPDVAGTIAGYLITETSAKPNANTIGWTAAAPTEYATPTIGTVTLYAWAMDEKGLVSNSLSDSVTIRKSSTYANVLVVAKRGGDFTDPVAAVNSITNASATSPYLVKVMPGTYDIGTGTLLMKEYVDIEGSGELVTRIIGSATTEVWAPAAAVLIGASHAEIRSLTVVNTGVAADSLRSVVAICAGTSPVMSNISLRIGDGSTKNAMGLFLSGGAAPVVKNSTIQVEALYSTYAVWMIDSSPTLANVDMMSTATWNARGIYSDNSSSTIRDSRLTVSSGIYDYGVEISRGTTTMTNVSLVSGRNCLWVTGGDPPTVVTLDRCNIETMAHAYDFKAIMVGSGGTTVRIGASKINGVVSGSPACVGSYNENYQPLDAACQPLP